MNRDELVQYLATLTCFLNSYPGVSSSIPPRNDGLDLLRDPNMGSMFKSEVFQANSRHYLDVDTVAIPLTNLCKMRNDWPVLIITAIFIGYFCTPAAGVIKLLFW